MKNKKVLLLVDPLNDFADKNGSLYVPGGEKIIPEINKLMNDVDFDEIILIQDWHPANHKSFASNNTDAELFSVIDLNGIEQVMWPDHCVQDTWGSEPHPDLDKKWTHIVQKGMKPEVDSYSAFYENDRKTHTEIHDLFTELNIRQHDDIYVVGLATDYCVKYTAIDAHMFHNNVYLVENCVAGINEDDVRKSIDLMTNVGIKIK